MNCDPLAFWPKLAARLSGGFIAEVYPGRPANAMLLCCRGKVLGLVAVEVLATQGKTGVGTIIRIIQNAEIAEISNCLADRLCLSGFHGLDFIIEETTGAPYLIELNPRCTQLGHLVLPGQGDLVGAFCRCLGSKTAYASDPPIDEKTVAFFPQAVAWNFDSPYFAQSHQDIPWQEPALCASCFASHGRNVDGPSGCTEGLAVAILTPSLTWRIWHLPSAKCFQKILGQLR